MQKVIKFKDKDVNMNPDGCIDVDLSKESYTMVLIG